MDDLLQKLKEKILRKFAAVEKLRATRGDGAAAVEVAAKVQEEVKEVGKLPLCFYC